jgi:threonine dehydrogenase-like Zn-dependent dehydrogenase
MLPAEHVLGHEFTGVIAGRGPGLGGWDLGERVAVFPMVACGKCYARRAGHLNLCAKGLDYRSGIGRQGRTPNRWSSLQACCAAWRPRSAMSMAR